MIKPTETLISREIRGAIKKAFPQIRLTRLQCGMAKGMRGGLIHLSDEGWPDYIGYLPNGRFFAVEVKKPDGRTERKRKQLQDERIADINSCGGFAIKASSVDEALTKINELIGENNG